MKNGFRAYCGNIMIASYMLRNVNSEGNLGQHQGKDYQSAWGTAMVLGAMLLYFFVLLYHELGWLRDQVTPEFSVPSFLLCIFK